MTARDCVRDRDRVHHHGHGHGHGHEPVCDHEFSHRHDHHGYGHDRGDWRKGLLQPSRFRVVRDDGSENIE